MLHLNGQASEFNYLQGKLDAYEAERRYQAQIEDYQAAWRQPYDNRSDYYQERDYESVNQLTEEGLPVYREKSLKVNLNLNVKGSNANNSFSNVGSRSKSQVAKKKRPKKKKAQESCQAST